MPWVKSEVCTGCGDCAEECPSGAILLVNDTPSVNMKDCIRCGSCHDLCPEEAIRHDGEKVPTHPLVKLLFNERLITMGSSDAREFVEGGLQRLRKIFSRVDMTLSQSGKSRLMICRN